MQIFAQHKAIIKSNTVRFKFIIYNKGTGALICTDYSINSFVDSKKYMQDNFKRQKSKIEMLIYFVNIDSSDKWNINF